VVWSLDSCNSGVGLLIHLPFHLKVTLTILVVSGILAFISKIASDAYGAAFLSAGQKRWGLAMLAFGLIALTCLMLVCLQAIWLYL